MAEHQTSADHLAGIVDGTRRSFATLSAKRFRHLSVAGIVLLSLIGTVFSAEDYKTWSNSSPVYLNTSGTGANISGMVLKFPVLLRLNPGNFQFFQQTFPGGADIRFAKPDGSHLPYQVERWVDNVGDNDTAEIWVMVDTILGNNPFQHIIMHWGKAGVADSSNSKAVFDTANGFAGVWHLDENPASGLAGIKDATINSNHATSRGAMTGADLMDAAISKGHRFDGSNDGDSIAQSGSLNIMSAITVSAWFKPNVLGNSGRICMKSHTSNVPPFSVYGFGVDLSNKLRGELSIGGTQFGVNGSTALNTSNFFYGVFTYDGTIMKLFLNGMQETFTTSQAGSIAINTVPVTIGKSNYNSNYFNGIIDEVVLSKKARTPDWIKLCYENQKPAQTLAKLPQHLTWDISTSASIQAGSGVWGTDNFWTKDGLNLQAWPGTGNFAKFAGADGSYTITVSGMQNTDGITFGNSGYTLTGGSSLVLGSGGNVSVVSGKSATITTTLSGSVGLTITGGGTLMLGGANNYTGGTRLIGSTVSVSVLSAGGASGPFGADGSSAPNMVLDSGTIIYTGSSLSCDRLFTVGPGGGTINNSGSGSIVFSNTGAIGLMPAGSRTITFSSAAAAAGTFAGTIGDNGGATSLNKDGTGIWTLTGDNTYSGVTTVSAGILRIGNGGTTGTVASASSIINNGILRIERSDNWVYGGVVSGAGAIEKNSAGMFILTGANTYIGGTTITSGTLQIGNGGTSGSIANAGSITNNGSLLFNRNDSYLYSGNISGTGSVTQAGTGTLTLGGSNSYTGTTTVSTGKLRFTGSLANGSTVNVTSGATLEGTGVINGTVNNNGTISPGPGGPGKLTIGSLGLGIGSVLAIELGIPGDTIVVNTNLTLDGTLTITGGSGFGSGTYTIATYGGTLTDNVITVGSAPGGYTYSVSATGGYVNVTVATIPARTWTGGGGNNLWSTPGNWVGSLVPTAADSVVFMASSYPCSLDVNVSVRSLMFTSGYSQIFYTNGKTLAIGKRLDVNMPGSMFCNGNDTIRFSGSESKQFIPKSSDFLPTIHQAGSGSTFVTGSGFKSINLLVTGGTLDLGNGYSDTVTGMVTVNGGSIDFNTATLTAQGDVDLDAAANLYSNGGSLEFSAASAKSFYPAAGVQHPRLLKSNTGVLTVRKNRLEAGRFNISDGQVVMDTALLADTVYMTGSVSLQLDTAESNRDTIGSLQGSGTFGFGKTTLHVSSTLHLNMFSSITGLGRLVFFGSDAMMFEPRYMFTHEKIVKTGSGTVQVSMYGLWTSKLFVEAGTWDWFTSGTDSVADTLSVNGGRMALYGSNVKVRALGGSGGTIDFNHGTITVSGVNGSANLSGITTIEPDTGMIRFSGAGASMQVFTPSATERCPVVEIQGGSGDTVTLVAALNAAAVKQSGGTLKWGDGFSHQIDTLRGWGGSMSFGSSTVTVVPGDVDLSGLAAVLSTTSVLSFTGTSGTQYLMPPTGVPLPAIDKSGAGTLMISAYPMTCKGLTVSSGTIDFGGRNCTVNGNLSIVNGTASTISGLDGITVAVSGGSASFSGQNGNLLDLSPVSPWDIDVTGGGTLHAAYADIGNCSAGGATGIAASSCADLSGNTNWTFLAADTFPPDNDMYLQTAAVTTDSVEIRWNPSVVDSTDRDLAGIWYKTTDYPDSAFDVTATFGGTFPIGDSVQLIGGLAPHTRYYFVVCVRDTSGNWSTVKAAYDSVFTYAEPPTIVSDISIVHKNKLYIVWNNPSGLAPIDSIYIHFDAVPSSGWIHDTTLPSIESSCTVTMPFSLEGNYRVMVSTRWDSAGIQHVEDALIDTFVYQIDAPSLSSPLVTVHKRNVPISFVEPAGLTTGDSIYLHIDTVTGVWGWTRYAAMLPGTTDTAILLPPHEGTYRYCVSTSLDSLGTMSTANRVVDTLEYVVDAPSLSSPLVTVHKRNVPISFVEPAGLMTGDSVYLHIDTVSGLWGWTRYAAMLPGATDTTILLPPHEGTYRYCVSTSLDSLGTMDAANRIIDTLDYVVDAPSLPSPVTLVHRRQVPVSFIEPAGLTAGDSIFIHVDTVNGSWGWYLNAALPPGSTASTIDLPAIEGTYRYSVSTILDSLGFMDPANRVIDSFTFEVAPPVLTTSFDITENLNPTVSWTAPAGVTTGDFFYVATDTVTGVYGWTSSGRFAYPSNSAAVAFSGTGQYRYRITSSLDSFPVIEPSNAAVDTITIVDSTPPSSIGIIISDNMGYTNKAYPWVMLSATGADSMRIGVAADTAAALWKKQSSPDSVDVSTGGDGLKRVFAQFKDVAGNRSGWTSDSTMYDATEPVVDSIGIVNNFGYTSDSDPRLTLGATGADSMRIGLQADTSSVTWKVYSSIDSIMISAGEGPKEVFVQFKDITDNRTPWVSVTIDFDTTAPGGSITIIDLNGVTSDSSPEVNIVAVGADSMRTSLAVDTGISYWKPFSSIDSVDIFAGGTGPKRVFIQFKDIAGNRSSWMSDTTVWDLTAPTGTILVVDNNGYTADPDPKLIIGGAGADSMRLSLETDTAWALWRVFSPVDSIDITSGGDGTRLIYLQLKNPLGNRSAWVSASTVVDTRAPVITVSTGGTYNDSSWPGFISGYVIDSLSGVDTVTATITRQTDGAYWNGALWMPKQFDNKVAAKTGWSLPVPADSLRDGMYVVSASGSDRAGNTGSSSNADAFSYFKRPVCRFSNSRQIGIAPFTANFTDSSDGLVEMREWRFGDGTIDTGTAVSHSYSATGGYAVTLLIHGPGGSDSLTIDSSVVVTFPAPLARGVVFPLTGFAPLTVTAIDSSTGNIASRRWTFGDGTTDTVVATTHSYNLAGAYPVYLTVQGPGGADSMVAGTVVVVDTTKPRPPSAIHTVALNCSTITVSWTPSVSTDVDTVSVNVTFSGGAVLPDGAGVISKVGLLTTSNTIYGIPPFCNAVTVRVFAIDRSGNRSDSAVEASVVTAMPDCRAPAYAMAVTMRSIGDTAVTTSIVVPPSTEHGLTVLAGTGGTRESAVASVNKLPYVDTLLTSGTLRTPGWYVAATAIADSSGNRSEFKFDSVEVRNIPPRIAIVADSLIVEDTLWTARLEVVDFNGDSVQCSVASGPRMAVLSVRTLEWTPDDADVGKQALVVKAIDARGAESFDTLTVVVVNREEPPVVSFVGDTVTDEGRFWRGHVSVADNDPEKKYTTVVEPKPAWAAVSGDTVSGTPSENDIGSTPLRYIVTDAGGLRDTLDVQIVVRNVNDLPVLVSNSTPLSVYEKSPLAGTVVIADEDRYDTLTLFWVVPCQWLTADKPVRDTAKRQWSIVLHGTPQQRDTGTVVVVIKCSDGAGAAVIMNDTVTVLDADDPPAPPVITRRQAFGAVEYRVSSRDDRDTSLMYSVKLQSLVDPSWFRSERSGSGRFTFYPLSDGRYILDARVIDRSDLETAPVYDTMLVEGASTHITGDTAWEMVSVPAQISTDNVPNSRYLLHWNEAVTERQVFHFYQQKTELPMLEPGKSYWRKGAGRDTITLSRGNLPTEPARIALVKKTAGWNQIASPYPYPIVWRGKSSVVWKWNAATGDFEENDSILEPWCGYWVQSDLTDSVTIDPVPVFSAKKLAKQKRTWFAGLHNWALQAVLTTASGSDAENRFGILPEAKDGFDQLDYPEPPRMSEKATLFFPHGDWKNGITEFAADFRKKMTSVNVFEVGISGVPHEATGAIRFDGYTPELPLYLFMSSGDSIVAVKPETAVNVHLKTGTTYRTLFVADNPDIMRLLPLRFSMGNAYPNPCRPSTRISYVLPYRWQKDGKLVTQEYTVSIALYDIMGRQIRALVYRKMVAGSYQVFWDGKNNCGRMVASGRYYLRLKADKFESTRNLMVLR